MNVVSLCGSVLHDLFHTFCGVKHAVQPRINHFDAGEEDDQKNPINGPSPQRGLLKVQMDDERPQDQAHPSVQMEGVGQNGLVGVVKPASRQRGPHPLPENVQRLRPHFADSPKSGHVSSHFEVTYLA